MQKRFLKNIIISFVGRLRKYVVASCFSYAEKTPGEDVESGAYIKSKMLAGSAWLPNEQPLKRDLNANYFLLSHFVICNARSRIADRNRTI